MTLNKEMENYMDSPTTDNYQWAAERMMMDLSDKQFVQVKNGLTMLDSILYKSWAKDLTLSELLSAVKDVRLCSGIK